MKSESRNNAFFLVGSLFVASVAIFAIFFAPDTKVKKSRQQLGSPSSQNKSVPKRVEVKKAEVNNKPVAVPGQYNASQRKVYKVRRGDNLSRIARKFNVTVPILKSENPELVKRLARRKNPDTIFPGEIINIPAWKKNEVGGSFSLADGKWVAIERTALDAKNQAFKEKNKAYQLLNARYLEAVSEKRLYAFLMVAIPLAITVIFVGFLLVFAHHVSNQLERSRKEKQEPQKVHSLWDDKDVRALNGSELLNLLSQPVVIDEHGNKVYNRTLENFLWERPNLLHVPLSEWQAKMNEIYNQNH